MFLLTKRATSEEILVAFFKGAKLWLIHTIVLIYFQWPSNNGPVFVLMKQCHDDFSLFVNRMLQIHIHFLNRLGIQLWLRPFHHFLTVNNNLLFMLR